MNSEDSFWDVPTIDLSTAPGAREAWDKPRWKVYAWAVAEIVFITNPWQVSSKLRVAVLRAFGAEIGDNVIFRPRTRVKFPWKLHIGDSTWIGEGVWFHNQDHVYVGDNVAISQETFLTTGSHAYRSDMSLTTKPITVESGVWITSRCMILGGAHIGRSAVVSPMTVVRGRVEANSIVVGPDGAVATRRRFNVEKTE
jgi:putative colanic acid biosynthesis acetyltransferase WcaF